MRLHETRLLNFADFIEQKTRTTLDEWHYLFLTYVAPETRRNKTGMDTCRTWAIWRSSLHGFYNKQLAEPRSSIRRYQVLAILSYNHMSEGRGARRNCSYEYIGLPRLHEKFQRFETSLR